MGAASSIGLGGMSAFYQKCFSISKLRVKNALRLKIMNIAKINFSRFLNQLVLRALKIIFLSKTHAQTIEKIFPISNIVSEP